MLEAKKCGLGAEAASIGELEHALQLGFDRSKIVYDSPVKTKAHLKHALNAGVVINLDNLEEVEKVNEILPDLNVDVTGKIGMRVNPNVGAGKIAMSSTAGKSSKFGLPMTGEFEEEVIKIILDNSWIQGLHQHIGSQGISLDQLTLGVERLVKLGIGFYSSTAVDVVFMIKKPSDSKENKRSRWKQANQIHRCRRRNPNRLRI